MRVRPLKPPVSITREPAGSGNAIPRASSSSSSATRAKAVVATQTGTPSACARRTNAIVPSTSSASPRSSHACSLPCARATAAIMKPSEECGRSAGSGTSIA